MARIPALPQIDGRRLRSYLIRIPLCTRGLTLIIIAFFLARIIWSGFSERTSLIPSEVSFTSAHRLNTYPFLHIGFIHFFLNLITIVPYLERFEVENGTLVTFLLFTGPFSTLPGIIYVLVEGVLFRGNIGIQGASIWIFLLMAAESIKTWRANPDFEIGGVKVPTWTYPAAICLVVSFLIPGVSLTGHACGLLIGYLWGLEYIKFLVPSQKILHWVEGKLNLLGRLPHYVSVDQKTYGRYGVLPSTSSGRSGSLSGGIQMRGPGQRLGS